MTKLFLPQERFVIVDPEMMTLSPPYSLSITIYHFTNLSGSRKSAVMPLAEIPDVSVNSGVQKKCYCWFPPRGAICSRWQSRFSTTEAWRVERQWVRERERESVNLKLPSIYLFFLTNGRKRNSRLMLMAGTVWESKRRQMCSCHMMKQTLGRNCHIAAQKKLHHVIESVWWFRLGLQCGYTRNRL